MIFLLATIFSSVFAQEESGGLLGVCGMYKASFPNGHAEADLSKPIIDYLPEAITADVRDLGAEGCTTEMFLELYEAQQAFCETNEETVDMVVSQLMSGQALSPESQAILDVAMFEIAVVVDDMQSRRNLFVFATAVGFTMVVGYAYFGYLAVGATMEVVRAVQDPEGQGCYDVPYITRRALGLVASSVELTLSDPSPNRLLDVSRRALSALPEISVESVLNACNYDVPSLVCTMSTSALTHAMLSEFCGANSVTTCLCDIPYLAALANGN